VSYSIVRRQGVEETTTESLDAGPAVRLLRDWARVYPGQQLVLRDAAGRPLAYRAPAGTAGLPVGFAVTGATDSVFPG